MKSTVAFLAGLASAAAFAPAAIPALRPADQRQASTAVRITKFGYPCSEGRGLIEADEKQAAKQNKLEGWLYRPAGENQQFADGPALYSKMEADNKAAKDTVRRWHNKK